MQVFDLNSEYYKIINKIDAVVIQTNELTIFISGPIVKEWTSSLGWNSAIKLENGLKRVIKNVKNIF